MKIFFIITMLSAFGAICEAKEIQSTLLKDGTVWFSPARSCDNQVDYDKLQLPGFSSYDVFPVVVVNGNQFSVYESYRFKRCANRPDGSYGFEIASVDPSSIEWNGSNLMNHLQISFQRLPTVDAQVLFTFALDQMLSEAQKQLFGQKQDILNLYFLVQMKDDIHFFNQLIEFDLVYSKQDAQYSPVIKDVLVLNEF